MQHATLVLHSMCTVIVGFAHERVKWSYIIKHHAYELLHKGFRCLVTLLHVCTAIFVVCMGCLERGWLCVSLVVEVYGSWGDGGEGWW